MSVDNLGSGPRHPWLRLTLLAAAAVAACIGFAISTGLGIALAAAAIAVYVGSFAWAMRAGRRRARTLRESGEKPDLSYLEPRLMTYFWLILICLVGATVGVALILTSPQSNGPAWPLVLALGVMALGPATIWVFARVGLRGRRDDQN